MFYLAVSLNSFLSCIYSSIAAVIYRSIYKMNKCFCFARFVVKHWQVIFSGPSAKQISVQTSCFLPETEQGGVRRNICHNVSFACTLWQTCPFSNNDSFSAIFTTVFFPLLASHWWCMQTGGTLSQQPIPPTEEVYTIHLVQAIQYTCRLDG